MADAIAHQVAAPPPVMHVQDSDSDSEAEEVLDSEEENGGGAAALLPVDGRAVLRGAVHALAAFASAVNVGGEAVEYPGLRDARVNARNRLVGFQKTLDENRAVGYIGFDRAFTDEERAVQAHMVKCHDNNVSSMGVRIKWLNKSLNANKFDARKYKAMDVSKEKAMERLLRKCAADVEKLKVKLEEDVARAVEKWADARKSHDAGSAASLNHDVHQLAALEQKLRHGPKKAFSDWKAKEDSRVILELVKSGHVESADATPVCMQCRSTACKPAVKDMHQYGLVKYTGAKDMARKAKVERQNASNAYIAMAWARKDTDPITLDVQDDPKEMCVAYPCKHVFVHAGLKPVMDSNRKCPSCRELICVVDRYTDEDFRPRVEKRGTSKEEEEEPAHKHARIEAPVAPLVHAL